MRARVRGNFEHLEFDCESRQRELVAFAHAVADGGYPVVIRAVYRHRVMLEQLGIPADVIGMMVGVEDGGEIQLVRAQVGEHRTRFAGIDDGGVVAQPQGPHVIVLKRADRINA